MHVEAGMAVEPSTDRGMLMGGVIVGDDGDVEIGRGLVIDGFEKGEPLLMASPAPAKAGGAAPSG
jgi:hypothetical protein